MGSSITPSRIEANNSEQTLTIVWEDSHISTYSLFGLRKNCPCVVCRGGHAKMDSFDRELFFVEPLRRYEINEIRQIGNHAIRIFWDDGHSNGMYRWETLRTLCPCEECVGREVGG